MQPFISFTNLVGNREGTTDKKSNRDKKSNPKGYMLPSVSPRTSRCPPVGTEGTWRFTICRPSYVVVLTPFTSQSHSPHAFHQSLCGWLVWLVEGRNPCLLFFFPSGGATWNLYKRTSIIFWVVVWPCQWLFQITLLKRQWQFWC